MTEDLWTPGRSFEALAIAKPAEDVVIIACKDGSVEHWTRKAINEWANQVAHLLSEFGVEQGDMISIVLPTCIEHVVATLGIYKIGACPMLVNASAPEAERDALLALVEPKAIFCDSSGISRQAMSDLSRFPSSPPTDRTPQPSKAVPSGGSTGRPKLIISPGAFAYPKNAHPFASILNLEPGDFVYSPGPLYHNQAFFLSQVILFIGGRILLNEKFQAEQALSLISELKPQVLNLVPTMMQRMLRSPSIENCNFDSVRMLLHMAAPCPEWAKLAWIELLGPKRVMEVWAATEVTGITQIWGDEWLEHRGSVGRGVMTTFRILNELGRECPTGEVGEIYSRFSDGKPQHMYIGSDDLPSSGDGFTSVGDMGYVDADGYLFLADRRTDVIISGGANIYPAEIEATLSALPSIRDVAVIGIPDEDLGRRVQAIIELADPSHPPTVDQLLEYCESKLARYKIPRDFEFVLELPRNEAGKIRRSALATQRSSD